MSVDLDLPSFYLLDSRRRPRCRDALNIRIRRMDKIIAAGGDSTPRTQRIVRVTYANQRVTIVESKKRIAIPAVLKCSLIPSLLRLPA